MIILGKCCKLKFIGYQSVILNEFGLIILIWSNVIQKRLGNFFTRTLIDFYVAVQAEFF